MKLLILSGGSGKRLWPLSTQDKPKQFIKFGEKSLIRMTFERFASCSLNFDDVYIITSDKYIYFVKEEIPEIPSENILKEPLSKNTGPAVMFALMSVKDEDIFIITPSDHFVRDYEKFCFHLKKASEFLKSTKEAILIFGIKPTHPETGYGYIKLGDEISDGIFRVERFVEKPSIEKANEMLEEGGYLWNSGIFMGYRSTFLRTFERFAPEVAKPFLELETKAAYESVPSISIDYAVMEKADNLYVLRSDFDWTDVGNWLTVEKLGIGFEKSKEVFVDSDGVFVINHVPAVIIGVNDLLVISTENGLLISSKEKFRNEDFLKALDSLNAQG